MKYIKPRINIQKLDIIEDILDDGMSVATTTTTTRTTTTLPTNPDTDDGNNPGYEILPTNAFNLGQ